MEFTIQPFSPNFVEPVNNLIAQIQQEFELLPEAPSPDMLNISTFYQKDRGNFWIALDRDHVIGMIALLDFGNAQAALRKMFVHSRYRGPQTGIAKKLLDTLLTWARGHHLIEIYLGTRDEFLAAHRFYEKHGFIEVPKGQLPSTFPLMEVDTKFYQLHL